MKIPAFFFLLLTLLCGCKKNDDPTPSVEDIQLEKLVKRWKASEVKLDDLTQDAYASFSVTFSKGSTPNTLSYNVSGTPNTSPWPTVGTWKFGSPVESKIIRDAGTANEIIIEYSVTENQLQITFMFTGEGFSVARTKEIEGEWVFTLTPD
jgi:hypothetical protein